MNVWAIDFWFQYGSDVLSRFDNHGGDPNFRRALVESSTSKRVIISKADYETQI